MKVPKKVSKKSSKGEKAVRAEDGYRPRVQLRFYDRDHHRLVVAAAKSRGLAMNAWLSEVTMKAAKADLNIK